MLDWYKAVGAPVETTCVVVMGILTPGTITVAVLLSVAVAIVATMVAPTKVSVLPVVVAKLGSLVGLTVATVDGVAATAALSRPVVESTSTGTAALPVTEAGCSVAKIEWSVGTGVAAAPVADGERASFLAEVGGCVESFFSTPPMLGCVA